MTFNLFKMKYLIKICKLIDNMNYEYIKINYNGMLKNILKYLVHSASVIL